MTVTILGREEYLAKLEMKKLLSGADEIREVKKINTEDLLWLSSDSLFSSDKALIYRTDELGADDELIDIISALRDTDTLIIRAISAKENTRLFKLLSSKTLIRVDAISRMQFSGFIKNGIKALDLKITGENFDYLVDRFGYESGLITLDEAALRLSHLSTFGDEITKAEIDYIVDAKNEQKVFDLIALLAQGKKKEFVVMGEKMSTDSRKVLSTLLWAIKLAIKLHIFSERELGLTAYQLRSIRPFVRYTDTKLERAIEIINEAFTRLNSNPMQKESYITALSLLAETFA